MSNFSFNKILLEYLKYSLSINKPIFLANRLFSFRIYIEKASASNSALSLVAYKDISFLIS